MFEEFSNCKNCELHKNRLEPVIYSGNLDSKILCISEAPGRMERIKGEPFQGKAGHLLDAILNGIDLTRNDLAIANCVLCWPGEKNPDPTDEQLEACRPNLLKIIERVKPEYTVVLGRIALKNLTGKDKITNNRGKFIGTLPEFQELIPEVFATFHPASALYDPTKKIKIAQDLAYIKNLVFDTADHLNFILVDTVEKFDAMCSKILECRLVSVDTETTGLEYKKDVIIGISFSVDRDIGYYVPVLERVDDDFFSFWSETDRRPIMNGIRGLLQHPSLQKSGQNFPFDRKMIKGDPSFGYEVSNVVFDTMFGAHLIDETCRKNLDALSMRYPDLAGYKRKLEKEVTKKDIREGNLSKASVEALTEYAGGDATTAYRLTEDIYNDIKGTKLEHLMFGISMPMSDVIYHMETNGIKVDLEYLHNLDETFGRDLENIDSNIFDIAGGEFNINSTDQLNEVLFKKLKLTKTEKTEKRGIHSTNKKSLAKLIPESPIIKLLLKRKAIHKLHSTYIKGMLKQVHEDGMVYASFGVTGTLTGRLNSSNPNLQNISKDQVDEYELGLSEYWSKIRPMFVPREGNLFIALDFSQIEIRLLAYYCRDEKLLTILEGGGDIHYDTAKAIFDEEEITSEKRRAAKTINFGIIYGLSPFQLAERLGITELQARMFIMNYFKTFPGIQEWKHSVLNFFSQNLYVENVFGRRRRIPEYRELRRGNLDKRDKGKKEFYEREVINFYPQSTASDVVKLAEIRCLREHPEAPQIAQIHDEIMFEVPEEKAEEYAVILKEVMERPVKPIDVFLPVEYAIEKRWGVPVDET